MIIRIVCSIEHEVREQTLLYKDSILNISKLLKKKKILRSKIWDIYERRPLLNAGKEQTV